VALEFYIRSDSVVSRLIAGETLIIPVRKGVGDLASIYSLNAVGTEIWEALSRPCSQLDVVERVAREFAAERTEIEHDVSAFLAELQSAGLIVPAGARAAS
jgi:hypothetical protein